MRSLSARVAAPTIECERSQEFFQIMTLWNLSPNIKPQPNPGQRAIEAEQSIERPYLLVTTCNQCYVDAVGRRYIDPLWAKDLALHANYISNLTLASPRIDGIPPKTFVAWEKFGKEPIAFVDLPYFPNLISAVVRLPEFVETLWSAISRAEIVHSGIA